MRKQWVELCRGAAARLPTYYAGSKKIHRNYSWTLDDPMGPLTHEELGFTKVKMTVLSNNYVHAESRDSAIKQWNSRDRERRAHNSVGFHCYNHIIKSHSAIALDGESTNKNTSVMGPCLQSIVISQTVTGTAEVNAYYRTTELFKKFPADLILIRDYLLNGFDFSQVPLGSITFHAANVTISPTYILVPLGVASDPVAFLETVKRGDPRFHGYCCKWVVKLLCSPEQKFNQARRTQRAAKKLLPDDKQRLLIDYSRRHME